MNNPLGVSHSTGNQGTTLGKEKNLLTSVGPRKKSFDLGGNRTHGTQATSKRRYGKYTRGVKG